MAFIGMRACMRNMKENERMVKNMVMEFILILIMIVMKVNDEIIKKMVKEHYTIQLALGMKDNGQMIQLKGKG